METDFSYFHTDLDALFDASVSGTSRLASPEPSIGRPSGLGSRKEPVPGAGSGDEGPIGIGVGVGVKGSRPNP